MGAAENGIPADGQASVWIVEDSADYRGTIVHVLNLVADLRCTGAFESVEAFQAASERAVAEGAGMPDVVLMDVNLPGSSGVDGVAWLAARHPDLPVVMLTVRHESAVVREALGAGAVGYLLKDTPLDEMLLGIRSARRGGLFLSPAVAARVFPYLRSPPPPEAHGLTPREAEVMGLVREGVPHKLVADRLGITPSTVGTHLQNVYQKLGVHSDKEALAVLYPTDRLPSVPSGDAGDGGRASTKGGGEGTMGVG